MNEYLRPFVETAAMMGGITLKDLLSRRRTNRICKVRFSIYKALRNNGFTLQEIGETFGYDHTTVINGLNSIQDMYDTEPNTRKLITKVIKLYDEFYNS